MNGLIKSNFLAVWPNAKVFLIFMLALGGFSVAVVSQPLLIGYALLGMVGFSVNAVLGIKKEFVSKWGKYKLSLPVTRADIIKSYFIGQLMWLLVGVLFAAAAISLSWLLHGCPFDNGVDTISVFALGVSVSVFTGAFFFPLFYLGGVERSEVLLVISLLFGGGLAFGIISLLNFYLDPEPGLPTVLLGAGVLSVCSLIMFALSYPLTVRIYRKQEY